MPFGVTFKKNVFAILNRGDGDNVRGSFFSSPSNSHLQFTLLMHKPISSSLIRLGFHSSFSICFVKIEMEFVA